MKRASLCNRQEKKLSCKAKLSLKWCATTHINQHPRIINKDSSTIISNKATSREEVKVDTITTEVIETIGEAMGAEAVTSSRITTTREREWQLLSSLIKKKVLIYKLLKQHKFRKMARSKSQGLLVEDRKNLMKVELANNNNTSQRLKLRVLRSKRLGILDPTDKYIRWKLSRQWLMQPHLLVWSNHHL